jgi:hypothetical protein
MLEAIINGWWKVIALLVAGVGAVWGLVYAAIHFLKKAKESGVDEIDAGPVKVDFEDKK